MIRLIFRLTGLAMDLIALAFLMVGIAASVLVLDGSLHFCPRGPVARRVVADGPVIAHRAREHLAEWSESARRWVTSGTEDTVQEAWEVRSNEGNIDP